ncbi:hypothetical protein [Idiomarina abyssalis]|uniref:hypothetical protein n=1 Tax=Idiomarina abyssalis TaxID=86102 RepID=UPI003A92999F
MRTQDIKTENFGMRVTPDFLNKIDDWRSTQRPIPDRTKAVQALIQKGLEAEAEEKTHA